MTFDDISIAFVLFRSLVISALVATALADVGLDAIQASSLI